MKLSKIALGIGLMVGLIAQSHATVINGGFENGDLTGWTAALAGGSASVVTTHTGGLSTAYSPQEGTYFLAIQAGSANNWQTVSRSVTMAVGDILSGWAAFDWRDSSLWLDGARVRILTAAGAEILPWVFHEDGGSTGYDGPWTAWSWTALTAGDYTLELGARNTLDSTFSSYGLFDDIRLTAACTGPDCNQGQVPEPATLALLGLGLLGLGAMRRRKA